MDTLKFKDGIAGFDKAGLQKWHGVDCKDHKLFTDVDYFFNSYGHRSTVEPYGLKDYALVVGCSHTMGVGIKESQVYWNQLNLKMPIYNLGLSGSGNDLICRNIQNFLKKFTKPKIIIIQWTDPNRFNIQNERVGAWYTNKTLLDLFVYGEKAKYWEHLHSNILRPFLLENLNLQKVPVVEFGIQFKHKDFYKTEYPMYTWDYADTARDGIHGGPVSHSNLARWLTNFLL